MKGRRAFFGVVIACAAQLLIGADGLAVAIALPALRDKGMASGIFETANHLFGGAVGVAVYATVLAATSYGTAFAVAAGFAVFGVVATRPRVTSPNVSPTKEGLTWQAKRK